MEYKWVISDLKAKIQDGELSNVIDTIHYRYQAEDGEYLTDVYGSVGLEAPEADSFIPADELTVADVEAWLESKLDVEALKEGLDAQIEAQKNPTHTSINLLPQESQGDSLS
jgi:hypothetical protein